MPELEDLRYPIGRFTPPLSFEPAMRADQISVLRLLPGNIQTAVSGLSHSQLDSPYRDGGWSVRQLIHHIADSHLNAYVRTKLALTEDWPTIKTYDESAWAQLADSTLPIDSSIAMISALHERWVALLESLPEAHLHRGYNHPELGRQELASVLALYSWHSRHHTAHITNLRKRMCW
jgi:hypothetical protein